VHGFRHTSRCFFLCVLIAAATPVGTAEDSLEKSCASLQQRFGSVLLEVLPPDVEVALLKRALEQGGKEFEAAGHPVPTTLEGEERDVALCAFLVTTWDHLVQRHFGAFVASLPESRRPATEAMLFKACLQDQIAHLLADPQERSADSGKNLLAAVAALEAAVRAQLAGESSPKLLDAYDRAMTDVDRVREVDSAMQMLKGLDSTQVLDDATRQTIASAVGERKAKVWRALKAAEGPPVNFAAAMKEAEADALHHLATVLPEEAYRIASDLWGSADVPAAE
jgi:hypothetical protein